MEDVTLFHLWHTHQINLRFYISFGGIETMSVWAMIDGDQTIPRAQMLLRFFNELAGTQHTLDPHGSKHVEEVRDGQGLLEIAVYLLWTLDLGTEQFPIFAHDEPMAERMATAIEGSVGRQRQALRLSPDGLGAYPGLRTTLGYTVQRMSAQPPEEWRRAHGLPENVPPPPPPFTLHSPISSPWPGDPPPSKLGTG
jgi:hypothetical protein